jgi:single-strand DNA-binding protein
MNSVALMGRLTAAPETRYSQGNNSIAVTRYTLAVDRPFKKDGEQSADFIRCLCFGRTAEFAEKYFRQGMKVAVTGSIRTGSYTNRDGQKVYTTDVLVNQQYFCESKASNERYGAAQSEPAADQTKGQDMGDGFMAIPDGIEEELPFA